MSDDVKGDPTIFLLPRGHGTCEFCYREYVPLFDLWWIIEGELSHGMNYRPHCPACICAVLEQFPNTDRQAGLE